MRLKEKLNYFFVIALAGILVHGYVLANKIPNIDDMTLIEGPGGGPVFQGRWMLGILGKFTNVLWNDMSMPWIKGIVAIGCIALSALFIIDMYEIQDKGLSICMGIMLVAFPTIAMNMTFMYLADHFCFAILCATLSAWIAIKAVALRKRLWLILSALCLCISLGIYQAYFPFAATLLLLDIIRCLYQEDTERQSITRIIYYFLTLSGGMGLYFLINKLIISVLGVDAIILYGKKMGEIHIRRIPAIISIMYKEFVKIFTDNYVGIHYYPIIRIIICIILIYVVGVIFHKTVQKVKDGKVWQAILLFGTVLAYPASVNLIYLMVVGDISDVYAMMVYSVVTVFLFLVILLEKITWKYIQIIKRAAMGILIIACIYYAKLDNDMYLYATISHNAAISYYTQMAERITCTEGYEATDRILFLGEGINQDSLYDLGDKFYHLQGIDGIAGFHNRNIVILIADHYLNKYCALPNTIEESKELKDYYEEKIVGYGMEEYPAKNSIRKIDDIIVVKLEDTN